jgi:cellulose synthase/poly-beta-1,6-N-acetylglucosamine synthase-like glycosyltransferase
LNFGIVALPDKPTRAKGARTILVLVKGTALERSVTVLLPVQDAQSTLADTVVEVLEAASDMTHRFELLIIDDGSTDATGEVAAELSRYYPQVRAIRHCRRLGREAAVQTGLAHSRGEVVFVRDPACLAFERIHPASEPARPNYLGRLRRHPGTAVPDASCCETPHR